MTSTWQDNADRSGDAVAIIAEWTYRPTASMPDHPLSQVTAQLVDGLAAHAHASLFDLGEDDRQEPICTPAAAMAVLHCILVGTSDVTSDTPPSEVTVVQRAMANVTAIRGVAAAALTALAAQSLEGCPTCGNVLTTGEVVTGGYCVPCTELAYPE